MAWAHCHARRAQGQGQVLPTSVPHIPMTPALDVLCQVLIPQDLCQGEARAGKTRPPGRAQGVTCSASHEGRAGQGADWGGLPEEVEGRREVASSLLNALLPPDSLLACPPVAGSHQTFPDFGAPAGRWTLPHAPYMRLPQLTHFPGS